MVRVSPVTRTGLSFAVTPDFLDIGEAEVLARALSRWHPSDDAAQLLADRAADARAGQEFLDLFGIADARLWDPRALWERVTGADRLRTPLGKTPTGKVVWLDLKEGAEGGVGPHGMLTGQTGSGKSESLLSFVLTMAMLHPPEAVQFLLGDFKGEATFAAVEHLPHVQGVVSNLASSSHKLDRLEDVIRGEVMRREEVLKAAGYKNVRDYETARATTKPQLEPLGALLIVADEFSELLAIRPDMAKVFEHVGLVGRALWIHILNASQRVETGKMAGLIPQQTYSIGMKVKDAAQSRAAIGSSRAYEDLKRAPKGSAFLVVDDEHTRYRSFYVSAPFVEPKAHAGRVLGEGHFVEAHRFTAAASPLPADIAEEPVTEAEDDAAEQPDVDAPTVLSVLADRVARAGAGLRPGHRLWLPPLEDTAAIPLDELVAEFWGRDWRQVSEDAGLVVPLAREDDPFHHSQEVVSLDMSAAGGNVAVAGATQSGKSTALRTLMMMLAVSHSPQRVQFYAIDLGGGQLNTVSLLPHVSAIAGRGNDEKMRRIVAEVERLLRARERSWELAELDLAEFRARKFGTAAGGVPEDGHGDVFLVIDNVKALHTDFTELYDRIASLAEGALNYGIHLMITNDQWISVRPQLLAKCGSRIEMRMASPIESEMGDREAAKKIPDQPGRALRRGGKHMLIGVPVADGVDASNAVAPTAAAVRQLWRDRDVPDAPELKMLPAEIGYTAMRHVGGDKLALGVGEIEMETVAVDLAVTPHFYAAGRSKSGRSTVLRTLCKSIMDTYTPQQAYVVLVDPNYQLADAIDEAYVKGYASTVSQAAAAATAVAQKLGERRPPPDMAPQDLARWRYDGPRWFVVVDDLNMLTPPGTSQSALFPLVGVIESARQLGFSLLAATTAERWHATGAMNKVLHAMNSVGPAVLVMDGDRQERIFDGVRPGNRVPGRGEFIARGRPHELVQVALPGPGVGS
jgi:S-DNA-T family DNA segregation ATPase FtsK/SpoIIIE